MRPTGPPGSRLQHVYLGLRCYRVKNRIFFFLFLRFLVCVQPWSFSCKVKSHLKELVPVVILFGTGLLLRSEVIDCNWPAAPEMPRNLSIYSSEIDFSLQRIGTLLTGL